MHCTLNANLFSGNLEGAMDVVEQIPRVYQNGELTYQACSRGCEKGGSGVHNHGHTLGISGIISENVTVK